MGLFGKKKDPSEAEIDEEFETEAEDSFESRKLRKQLRDLKSENKQKRKEPPKPWGRRERLTVLIVMTITILISSVLFLSSNNNFQFSSFQFPLNFQFSNINFSSLNIFKEQTIEIRKK